MDMFGSAGLFYFLAAISFFLGVMSLYPNRSKSKLLTDWGIKRPVPEPVSEVIKPEE
jgi:hypothetical protein